MKTRLIVLIDFSPYAETLLQLANTWCKLLHAELVLVHKVTGYAPAFAESDVRHQIIQVEKEEALAKLRTLAHENITTPKNIRYQVFKEGFLLFFPKLLRQGREQGFNDLIVLGLKGTGFLKKILVGSTATAIIEELNHPTVAVPVSVNKLIPKKFIVALSYKYPLNEAAFKQVLEAFQNNIQQLEFISVSATAESEDYLKGLQAQHQKSIPSSYRIFRGTQADAFKEIKRYVHQQADSILVVQKGSRSLSDQVFRKFLINELVHDGSLPLIIVPL